LPTRWFLGHAVPATGLVLIPTPAGIVVEASPLGWPGIRPLAGRGASAWAIGWPVTGGTSIRTGPSETTMVTVPPCLILAPGAGLGLSPCPVGTLLCWPGPRCTWKCRFFSSEVATWAFSPVTLGVVV